MPDVTVEKLEQCFADVFPNIEADRIRSASVETVSEWDSVAHVTLLSLLAETFELDMDVEEFETATSFDAVLAYVRRKTASA